MLLPALNWGDPVDTDGDFLLPTGTVTLLMADVEASTRQWEQDDVAMNAAMNHLNDLVTDLVGRHDGARPLEQGEGDSFVAAFARASEAVACAIAIQQKSQEGPLRLRMGIHSAEAQRGVDKTYVGPPMNRTARLRDAGHGGQILLSATTAELVADHLPAGAFLADLGTHRLKDLGRPERIFELRGVGVDAPFPPLRTLDTYRHNLPEERTRFFGRVEESAAVAALVGDNRLVTLHGAGGCGKTRLALHAAAGLLERHPDGVFFVDLSTASDAVGVTRAILDALGLTREPDAALDTYLAGKDMLLLLDNCEHVVTACASIVDRLITIAPGFRVLATSREGLGVPGEVTYDVPPLPVPPDEPVRGIEGLAPFAAAELFVDRVKRVRPGFTPDEDDARAIVEICRRLDGVPLAIELAAARTRAMTPAEIAAGLGERFRLLTGGARTAMPRQQTLHASVDWSHDLLTEPERIVFRRLAVFVGGFTLDAARDVVSGDGVDPHQVVDLVALLVDKSLVVAGSEGQSTRYRMLETVRAYAADALDAAGEAPATKRRHRDHFAATSREPIDVEDSDADLDNRWAAYRCSVEEGALEPAGRLAVSLAWAASNGDRDVDISAVLADADRLEPTVRTSLLACTAVRGRPARELLAFLESDRAWCADRGLVGRAAMLESIAGAGSGVPPSVEALRRVEELHRIALDAGDHVAAVVIALRLLITAEWGIADLDSTPYWEQVIDAFRAVRPGLERPWLVSRAMDLSYKGFARKGLEMSEELLDTTGGWRASTLTDRATCLMTLGRVDEAVALLVESSSLAEQLGLQHALGVARHRQGLTRLLAGDAAGAVALFEEAVRLITASESSFGRPTIVRIWSDIAELRGALLNDAAGAQRAVAAGRDLAFSPWQHAFVERACCALARVEGDLDEAEDKAYETLAGSAPFRNVRSVSLALETIAGARARSGKVTEAARIMGAASALRDEVGDLQRFPPWAGWYEEDVEFVRSSLSREEFEGAWAEGASMAWPDAVAYVQRGRGERKRPSSGWRSLTPTEVQVVELVAEGLTNQDVAERLLMSSRTVGTHLTHVYAKVGVAGRTELTAAWLKRTDRAAPGG